MLCIPVGLVVTLGDHVDSAAGALFLECSSLAAQLTSLLLLLFFQILLLTLYLLSSTSHDDT